MTEMHVAEDTVSAHRKNICRKLGVRGIAELTKLAVRDGLSTIDSGASVPEVRRSR